MKNLYLKFVNWYQFDIVDIIAFLYTVCVVGIVGMGLNMNILFTLTVVISLISVLNSGRLNLLIMNGMFLILNVYYLIS